MDSLAMYFIYEVFLHSNSTIEVTMQNIFNNNDINISDKNKELSLFFESFILSKRM